MLTNEDRRLIHGLIQERERILSERETYRQIIEKLKQAEKRYTGELKAISFQRIADKFDCYVSDVWRIAHPGKFCGVEQKSPG